MDFTEFHKFVQRLTNQYGSSRITAYVKEDCSAPYNYSKYTCTQFEFDSHFGRNSVLKKQGLKSFMDATLGIKRPAYRIIEILIKNDRLMLDLTTSRNISSKDGKFTIELTSTKSILAQPTTGHVIPLYEGFFIDEHRRLVMDLKGSRELSVECAKFVMDLTSQKEKQSQHKLDELHKRWLSGKYISRNLCSKTACQDLKISFSTARKVLRNMPEPCR